MVLLLAVVQWYVHVVALPPIFRGQLKMRTNAIRLIIRGIAFMTIAPVLIPKMEIFSFLTVGMVVAFATHGLLGLPPVSSAWTHAPSWAELVHDDLLGMLVAGLVGATIGMLLHDLRYQDTLR